MTLDNFVCQDSRKRFIAIDNDKGNRFLACSVLRKYVVAIQSQSS